MEYIYGPKDTGYKDLYIDVSAKEQRLPEVFQEIGRAKGSLSAALYGYVAIGTNNRYPIFFKYQPYTGLESGRGKYFLHARSLGEGPEYYASRDFYKNFNMLFAQESDIVAVSENNEVPQIEYINKLEAYPIDKNAMTEIVYRILLKRPTVVAISDELYNAEGYRYLAKQIFAYLPHSLKKWCSFATGIPNNDYFRLTIIPASLKKKAVEYIDLCDNNIAYAPHNDTVYEIAVHIIKIGLQEREVLFNDFETIFGNANYDKTDFDDYFNAIVNKDESLLKSMIVTFLQNEYENEVARMPDSLKTYWSAKFNDLAYLDKIYEFAYIKYNEFMFTVKDFIDSNLTEIDITYMLNAHADEYFRSKIEAMYPKVINADLSRYFIEKINDMSYPEPFVPETDLPAEKKILDIVNNCNAVFKARLIEWKKRDDKFKKDLTAELNKIDTRMIDMENKCFNTYATQIGKIKTNMLNFDHLYDYIDEARKQRNEERARQKQLDEQKAEADREYQKELAAQERILKSLAEPDKEFLSNWKILTDDFADDVQPANRFIAEEYTVKYLMGHYKLIVPKPSEPYDYDEISEDDILRTMMNKGSSFFDIAKRFSRMLLDVSIAMIIKYSPDVQTLMDSLLRVIKQSSLGLKEISHLQLKSLMNYIDNNYNKDFMLDDALTQKMLSCLKIAEDRKDKSLLEVLVKLKNNFSKAMKKNKSAGETKSEAALLDSKQKTANVNDKTENETKKLRGFFQIAQYIDEQYYSGKKADDKYYVALINQTGNGYNNRFLMEEYLAKYFADQYELYHNFTIEKIQRLMASDFFKEMLKDKKFSQLDFAKRLAVVSIPCAIGMIVRNEDDVNESMEAIFELLHPPKGNKIRSLSGDQIDLICADIRQNAYRGNVLDSDPKKTLRRYLNIAENEKDDKNKALLQALEDIWCTSTRRVTSQNSANRSRQTRSYATTTEIPIKKNLATTTEIPIKKALTDDKKTAPKTTPVGNKQAVKETVPAAPKRPVSNRTLERQPKKTISERSEEMDIQRRTTPQRRKKRLNIEFIQLAIVAVLIFALVAFVIFLVIKHLLSPSGTGDVAETTAAMQYLKPIRMLLCRYHILNM